MATHPFFPTDLVIPDYVPSTWTVGGLFGVFGAAVFIVTTAAYLFARPFKHLSNLDRTIICWWAVTGAIHMLQEGAFVIDPKFYASTAHDYFSDAWKEYSKADSRYAMRDPFVVSVEAVTAFIEGPLCYLIIYAMAYKKPYQHILQFSVAFGQFYGDVLYFATCVLDNFKHSDPRFLYFWVYFVGMNGLWLLIPGLIMIRTWKASVAAIAASNSKKDR